MYNKSEVKPIGRKKIRVRNPKNKNMYTVEFIIVKGQCKSIVGLETCEELELLTVNRQIISLVTSQSTNTQGLSEQDIVNSFCKMMHCFCCSFLETYFFEKLQSKLVANHYYLFRMTHGYQ